MVDRRNFLAGAGPLLAAQAAEAQQGAMALCMHQTTSAGASFRQSLEGYAKAEIRYVELIPPLLDEFLKTETIATVRRLLSDLGIKPVSSGGVRGLAEPNPGRAKALEDLKRRAELMAQVGVDRMVCPCATQEKFTADDYKRGADNLREAGEVAKPFGVVAMLEFMRGSTFAGTLPTALALVREAGHPNFRPMFDFYHFWAGLSKFEDLEEIRDGEIHHVHFQDVPRIQRELLDNGTRDIPGDGTAPLVRILEVLKRKGYRGPLSVELFYPRLQKGDPFEVASEIRRKSEPIMRRAQVL